MAMCPLLREEYRGEQCAWWYEANDPEDRECVVTLLPDLLNDIADVLEAVEKEVGGVNQQLWDGIAVDIRKGQ